MKPTYNKPALSFSEQITNLEQKGMSFQCKFSAHQKLANISYYRLSGYWYPNKQLDKNNRVTNLFKENTHFDEIISLYEQDRSLRLLILDAIERIEVSVRTQFTYHVGGKYGPLGYINPENFNDNFRHNDWLSSLQREAERSNDEFIKHFKNKYAGFPSIPIWMLTEVMSLGALSRGYRGLKNNQKKGVEDKNFIAKHFNVHYKTFEKWLHILTYVRNICAHHSRLWNRKLAIQATKSTDKNWTSPLTPHKDRLFYVLLIINHLLKTVGNSSKWVRQVNQLLDQLVTCRKRQIAMGLPDNWKEHPLWK